MVLEYLFRHKIITVKEAKEFYPHFGLGANVALIFSGHTLKYFSNMRKNLGPRVDGWPIPLKDMTSILVVLGLVITGVYWGVNRFVIDTSSMQRKKKVRPKLIMGETVRA